MGSSRAPEDRSLGSGISFPQWMRGKVDSRFDFDQSSFSPPSADDSFFYIRYPSSSTTAQPQHTGFHSISQVLNEQNPSTSTTTAESLKPLTSETTNNKENKSIDFSKLPLPCQPFVPVASKSHPYEAKGTDDGFHGEPARCGKSIVTVANRIMQSSIIGKKSDNDKLTTTTASSSSKMEKDQDLRGGGSKVSKSLPVTPIASPTSTPEGSPKSRRRNNGNRYFTGAFIPDRDKYQGGWLLSSILSQSREIIGNKIEEDDEGIEIHVPHRALNRKKSISSQNLIYFGKDDNNTAGKSTATTVTLQAKPSELREMNFWSPTSM